jgi:hypothetical protein
MTSEDALAKAVEWEEAASRETSERNRNECLRLSGKWIALAEKLASEGK